MRGAWRGAALLLALALTGSAQAQDLIIDEVILPEPEQDRPQPQAAGTAVTAPVPELRTGRDQLVRMDPRLNVSFALVELSSFSVPLFLHQPQPRGVLHTHEPTVFDGESLRQGILDEQISITQDGRLIRTGAEEAQGSLCFKEQKTLTGNCFASSVSIEYRPEHNAPVGQGITVGSAVLLDAQRGLFLSAAHVQEKHRGIFSHRTSSGKDHGWVSARYQTIKEDGSTTRWEQAYPIRRAAWGDVTFAVSQSLDLLLFQLARPEELAQASLLEAHKILSLKDGRRVREMRNAVIVAAGYGDSPLNAELDNGVRRFSSFAVTDCNKLAARCHPARSFWTDAQWFRHDQHCKTDSGGPAYAEIAPEGMGKQIAIVGILSGEETISSGGQQLACSDITEFTDLTFPAARDWIIRNAARLTGQSEAWVEAAYFIDATLVPAPKPELSVATDIE